MNFHWKLKFTFPILHLNLCKLKITKNNYEESIKLEKGYNNKLQYISIDPELKILKEINFVKFTVEIDGTPAKLTFMDMLTNQLKQGKNVVERIYATRSLRK